MTRPGRCTRAERDARVVEIREAMALGASPTAAARTVLADAGVTGRETIRRYVRAAFASLQRDRKMSGAKASSLLFGMLRSTYRRSRELDDVGAALRAIFLLKELLVTSNQVPTSTLQPDVPPEIDSRLRALASACVAAVEQRLIQCGIEHEYFGSVVASDIETALWVAQGRPRTPPTTNGTPAPNRLPPDATN